MTRTTLDLGARMRPMPPSRPVPLGQKLRLSYVPAARVLKGIELYLALALVGVWTLMQSLDGIPSYLPSFDNIAILVVYLAIIRRIRSRISYAICLFWAFWFVIGSVSLATANVFNVVMYNVDVAAANRFYLLASLAMAIGILLFERLTRGQAHFRRTFPLRDDPLLLKLCILAFPVAYIVSIVSGAGDVPLLSGRVLAESMYETSYGPIHKFGIVAAVSTAYGFLIFYKRPRLSLQTAILCGLLVLSFVFLSVADGRRFLGIVGIFAISLAFIDFLKKARQVAMVLFLSLSVITAYVVVMEVRTLGSSHVVTGWARPFWVMGVEYRDFAHVHDRYTPQDLDRVGYDWPLSTLASVTPSTLFNLSGIDKQDAVTRDSARSLMRLFGGDLGIRIGLPGELWIWCGWLSLLPMFLFGLLIGFVSKIAARTRTLIGYTIALISVSVLGLACVGQSTVTFGGQTTLLYLLLATALFRMKPIAGTRLKGA